MSFFGNFLHKGTIYVKTINEMACACKKGSSKKQVTAVKQVVKKKSVAQTPAPRRNVNRRVVYRRPI
jgi:hypothetical protein